MARKEIKVLQSLKAQQEMQITDDYSCGVYNGIELSLAVLEGREPVFKTFEGDPKESKGEEEKPGRTAYSGVRVRRRKESADEK